MKHIKLSVGSQLDQSEERRTHTTVEFEKHNSNKSDQLFISFSVSVSVLMKVAMQGERVEL